MSETTGIAPDAALDDDGVEVTVGGEEFSGDYMTESAPVAPRVFREGADSGMGTGRRKEAVVRVRMVRGTGQWKLNGRSLDEYFPSRLHQQLITEPLRTVERIGQYDVVARLSGGGVSGQAGALRLGIARALIEINPDDRPALKKAGFLTRDPRVVESKKYGLKKARKAPQYSKR